MYAEQFSDPDQTVLVSVPGGPSSQAMVKQTDKPQQIAEQKAKTVAEYATDYIAGLAGGCAGLIFGHPFDTVKVRQQTSGGSSSVVRHTYRTYKHGGINGFYKGLAFPLLAEGFRNMIFFGVYGSTIKMQHADHLDEEYDPSYKQIAVAGAVGGCMQAIPAVPIELVKVKLQTQFGKVAAQASLGKAAEKQYSGPIDCIRSIYRNYGLRGCFRGLTMTVCRDITGFTVYITSYQYLCKKFTPEGAKDCSIPYLLLAGGLGGTFSWLVNIPMDVIKSRLQEDSLSHPKYKGSIDCIRQSYRNDGLRVFWRGLPVTCVRAFPVNAVTFAVYTLSLRWMEGLLHNTT